MGSQASATGGKQRILQSPEVPKKLVQKKKIKEKSIEKFPNEK